MSNICVSSQEEKFIFVVDKYITHHRDSVNNNIFYRKLYVLFAGYHLKYFYSRAQYRNSCYHVDNIMQMFMGVVSTLKAPLLRQLANSDTLLHCLNSLVNYISGNLDEAEHIYADLLAQYEKKRIARSLAYTPPGSVVRKRLWGSGYVLDRGWQSDIKAVVSRKTLPGIKKAGATGLVSCLAGLFYCGLTYQ